MARIIRTNKNTIQVVEGECRRQAAHRRSDLSRDRRTHCAARAGVLQLCSHHRGVRPGWCSLVGCRELRCFCVARVALAHCLRISCCGPQSIASATRFPRPRPSIDIGPALFLRFGDLARSVSIHGLSWIVSPSDVFKHIMWAAVPTRMSLILVIAVAPTEDIRVRCEPDICHRSPRLTALLPKNANLTRIILNRVGRS